MIGVDPVVAGFAHVTRIVDPVFATPTLATFAGFTTDTAPGETGSELSDANPVPALLVAATENRYAVPLVRPLTLANPTASSADAVIVAVAPPGAAVTV